MISTYREDRPWLLLTVPFWSLIPWIGSALDRHTLQVGSGAVAYVLQWAADHPGWAPVLLGTVFTSVVVLQLVTLVNDAELATRRGMLPIILFPLLLALDGAHRQPGPELLALPLVLLAVRRSWSVGADRHALGGLFDAGLLIGAASVLYAPYVVLLLAVWSTTAVFRPFGWRDHLVPMLAVLLVRWLAWGMAELTGTELASPWPRISPVPIPSIDGGLARSLLFWTVISLLLLLALVAFVQGYQRSVMHGKNIRSAMLAFAVCGVLLAVFAWSSGSSSPAVVSAAPAAILLCAPFSSVRRRWMITMVWIGLFALAVWTQWAAGLSSPA